MSDRIVALAGRTDLEVLSALMARQLLFPLLAELCDPPSEQSLIGLQYSGTLFLSGECPSQALCFTGIHTRGRGN